MKDLFTLRDDSADTTETGQITRGRGVVEVNEAEVENSHKVDAKAESGDTLEVVMKSKGLCGVFDHDFVENTSSKKKPSVIEMEENAKKVAQKAILTLKSSTANTDKFAPTWTGSHETLAARRNGVGNIGGNKMESSSSMLAQLRKKRMEISASAQAEAPKTNNGTSTQDQKYNALLLRLQKYIKHKNSNGNGPTTKDILNDFKDVGDDDAAIFRSMLKSIAAVKNGCWIMK